MARPLLFVLALVLPIAACDRHGDGTSVTINADGGNTTGGIDGKSGEVKLNLPGFSGQFKLPKLKLDATNFDLNGVHLYPGSTIEAMDLAAGHGDGGLRVRFTSPASPGQVRDWFGERLGKAGFTLKPDGQGLIGTTEERKPFRLDLAGDGDARTKGTITLGG